MYISPINKLGFIHIPKNGGSTISSILSENLTYFDVLIGGVERFKELDRHYHCNFKLSKHSTYERLHDISKMFDINWFTTLREPISRVISIYKWSKKQPNLYSGYDYENINTFIQSEKFVKTNGVDMLHASQCSFISYKNIINKNIKLFRIEDNQKISKFLEKYFNKPIDFSVKKNETNLNEDFTLDIKSNEIMKLKYKEDFILYKSFNK